MKTKNNNIKMLQSWTDIGLRLNAVFAFCYIILAASIVSQLVKDRVSNAKESRG